jgi:hypothetical protein
MENVLLLTIGTGCYTFHAFINHWVLSCGGQISKLALQKFIQIPQSEELKYGTVFKMLEALDLTKYSSALRTTFVTSLFLLLVFSFPASRNIKQWRKDNYSLKWWYGILQIGITAALVAVLLYADLAKAPAPVVNLIGSADSYMEADIISGDALSQSFEVNEDTDIHELIILVSNSNNTRNLRNVAVFSIVDDETQELILQKEVGTALVYTDKKYIIDLGKAKLLQGHTYTLSVTTDMAVQKGAEIFSFAKTGTLELEGYPLFINGKPQDYNLAFTLR